MCNHYVRHQFACRGYCLAAVSHSRIMRETRNILESWRVKFSLPGTGHRHTQAERAEHSLRSWGLSTWRQLPYLRITPTYFTLTYGKCSCDTHERWLTALHSHESLVVNFKVRRPWIGSILLYFDEKITDWHVFMSSVDRELKFEPSLDIFTFDVSVIDSQPILNKRKVNPCVQSMLKLKVDWKYLCYEC